jgi:lipopolysaccharide/colanic/teichoic acid biosynthesis glycosyltransferase
MALELRSENISLPAQADIDSGWRALKRAFDLIVGGAALFGAALLLVVLMLAIVAESPTNPIFRQRRLGLNGKPFWLLKLRTMVPDAERRRAEVEYLNEAKPPLFKARRDPRVTRVGRFLRATSLDELPQLINVVLGDMSLVGPRPRLPQEFDLGDPEQFHRFSVKPGLAGLWQVSGRATLNFDEALAIDLQYVDNWSFWWDLELIWRTFLVVVTRQGAY